MIETLWTFLTSAENRAVLSWLGGGIAAAAAGIWTLVKFLAERQKTDETKSPNEWSAVQEIRAGRAGSAAGGDINRHSGNIVTIKSGLSGGHLLTIMAILVGVGILAISQIGSRVTAEDCSAAVSGDVSGSTFNVCE